MGDGHPQIITYDTQHIILNGVSLIYIQDNMNCTETRLVPLSLYLSVSLDFSLSCVCPKSLLTGECFVSKGTCQMKYTAVHVHIGLLQFFFFLLIIFAIEVAAGIWCFSNQSKVVDDITQFYMETYQNYQNTRQDTLRETLRLIQTGLDCCGTGSVVDSAKDTCPPRDGLVSLITKSCPDAIDELFDSKLHIIGGVGIATGVIMMFGMIFSMLLCCAIRKSREIV
uniref:CD9 antigen n=1 Tax=Oncorhynchus tshawytscha TaxID=74940 RepID=A0AAZ3QX70_ONCTS